MSTQRFGASDVALGLISDSTRLRVDSIGKEDSGGSKVSNTLDGVLSHSVPCSIASVFGAIRCALSTGGTSCAGGLHSTASFRGETGRRGATLTGLLADVEDAAAGGKTEQSASKLKGPAELVFMK